MADRFYTGILRLVEIGIPPKIKNHLVLGQTNVTTASVYLGTNQTGLVDAAWTKVLLDTEFADIGGNFSSNQYVAPVTGYYLFSWGAMFYTSAGGNHLLNAKTDLYVGGVATGRRGSAYVGPAIEYYLSVGAAIMPLTATNYVDLRVSGYTDDASTYQLQAGGWTRLDVMLLSK
jgi:hypothetical protein